MSDPESVISVDRLTRRFGAKLALDDVSLHVPARPSSASSAPTGPARRRSSSTCSACSGRRPGSVRVFGRDPVADPVGVLSRIGYLSEDHDLPGWMRVGELMRYTEAFFPGLGPATTPRSSDATSTSTRAPKVKHLSRGQRTRAGLLVALAHRPDLLVLDEPSSGLDPIVRRDILGAIIRTIADEGRTVLFSSHLLDEVERVSDHVALLDRGQRRLRGAARRAQGDAPPADAAVRRVPAEAAGAGRGAGVGRRGPRVDGPVPRRARRAAGRGRGGRRPGRRSRRAVARRDLRGPSRGEHYMKTPAFAIGWTIWRRHRWGLIATVACVAIVVVAAMYRGPDDSRLGRRSPSLRDRSSPRLWSVHSTWPRCSHTGSTPIW